MVTGLLSRAKRENYLYVEGSDDKNVFIHLLNHHGITDRNRIGYFKNRDELFEIKACGSISELLSIFRLSLKSDTDNKIYGIVIDDDIDADPNTGITVNWQKLRSILKVYNYNIPAVPDENGVIIRQDGLPMIGIWLMPNNKLPGAIEDFVSFWDLKMMNYGPLPKAH